MPGYLDLEHLAERVSLGLIDTIIVCFPDMQGRLVGKRFHAEHFVRTGHAETHGCDYLLANDIEMEPVPGYKVASWQKGYGDFVMAPDMSTLIEVPWLEGTALVLCDILDHHDHWPLAHSPRAILQRQLHRLEERGMRAFFASELEFYLFDETYASARQQGWQHLQTASEFIQDYVIGATSKEERLMRQIRNGLVGAGIPVENSKGEWGPGQEEINIRYADALVMADRHVVLKNGIKEMAQEAGNAVTFMAKYNYDLAGSSCHIHASLWDRDGTTPLFLEPDAPFGMSKLMRQFVGGQLAHAAELTWFLAPYINSYKRFQAGTFAPTRIVLSGDNRTAGFRIVGEKTKAQRIECRIGGADLNPYLAFAALIAAGLAGIDNGLDCGEPYRGDAYADTELPEVPKTLRDATSAMDNSAMLRSAMGDEVIDHYVHTARWEQLEYDRRVTDFELKRGFERY
jgi:glutamine synthetase